MSIMYCQCYSGNMRITCSKCHLIFNTNSGKITEQDSKQVMLEKLKKELQSLRANIMCLKIDIRDLEKEIAEEETSTEEECILSSGAVVEKAGLPNCDCSSCN